MQGGLFDDLFDGLDDGKQEQLDLTMYGKPIATLTDKKRSAEPHQKYIAREISKERLDQELKNCNQARHVSRRGKVILSTSKDRRSQLQ